MQPVSAVWVGGFLFPAVPPVVCFAPGLSLPTCTAGSCLILLMETVPCRCLKILPFTLPVCSYTRGINALCQLLLPADRLLCHSGQTSERFLETQHAALQLAQALYLKESKKFCS